MELRPRKGRVSSASEPNSSTPAVSVKAKNQHGSPQTVLALPSSRRKPSRVKSSSRSTASKSRTCLTFEEEDDQQQENSVCNEKDEGPSESVQEVISDTVSSRGAQGCVDRGSAAIQLDSDPIDVFNGSISKVNSEHRKLLSKRKDALRTDETAQVLFEADKCALDRKNTVLTGIELLHENVNEACYTNKNDILGSSTPETILIGNGHQKKAKRRHTSLAEAEQIERGSLMHLVADTDVHQAVDGRETDWRGREVMVASARSVEEYDVQTIVEIKQGSCANLQGSVHEGEEPASSILQQESFEGTGADPALSAGRSSGKSFKTRRTDVRRTLSEQKGRNKSCFEVNAQESDFDSKEILCNIKHGETGKEGNAGLESTEKNGRLHAEANSYDGSTNEIIGEKDTDTEEHHLVAEENKFKGFSGEESFVRTEQDCEEVVHEDEDEGNMARIFIGSLKARLQQIPVESFTSIRKEMAAKVNGCEEEDNVTKKAATTEGRQITTSSSRLTSAGLSWSPETGLQATKNSRCRGSDVKGTVMRVPETIWQKEKKLQDGLLVPPVEPRKLNKLAKKQAKDTAGAKWFDLSAPTITPELKKDLQLLKLRNVIDPKRHYKAEDSKGLPKYFQVGTVIGGPADFYSGRLTKKERKSTLADELLSDSTLSAYRKRKYLDIQDKKQAGGKKFWNKKKNQRAPSWARI